MNSMTKRGEGDRVSNDPENSKGKLTTNMMLAEHIHTNSQRTKKETVENRRNRTRKLTTYTAL